MMPEQAEKSTLPLVQIVVQLKPTKLSGELLTPSESADLADEVLMRVTSKIGRSPSKVNVLRNIASIIIEADDEFQRFLASQPEVESVIPNNSIESLNLPPVRKQKL